MEADNMSFVLEEGNLDDARSIAHVLLDIAIHDDQDKESKTEEQLAQMFLERVRTAMQSETQLYIVARQPQSRNIIGFAYWILPGEPDDGWKTEAKEGSADDAAVRDSQQRQIFLSNVISMQREYFKGKKHTVLASLAVKSEYRKRGVASALIKWGIVNAKWDNLPMCLIVREGNHKAMGIYARLGFKEYQKIYMPEPGGKTASQFIGMVREPK